MIADITSKSYLQTFQEMQFAIEFHTEGVTGSSMCVYPFNSLETGLAADWQNALPRLWC